MFNHGSDYTEIESSYDEQGNALRTEASALADAGPEIEILSCTATDRRQESLREIAKAKLFEALHPLRRMVIGITREEYRKLCNTALGGRMIP